MAEVLSFQGPIVDVHAEGMAEEMVRLLERDGLAVYGGIESPDHFVEIGSSLGRISSHPNADSRGLTLISPRAGYSSGSFSEAAIYPHTDSSTIAQPPTVVMLYCRTQAPTGGETVLVDGRALYEAVRDHDSLLQILTTPGSCVFGMDPQPARAPILTLIDDRAAIRFRYDECGFFSGPMMRAMPKLLEILDGLRIQFKLEAGQGYAVHNSRWLHGRNDFRGDREMYRLLVWPAGSSGDTLGRGFQIATHAAPLSA